MVVIATAARADPREPRAPRPRRSAERRLILVLVARWAPGASPDPGASMGGGLGFPNAMALREALRARHRTPDAFERAHVDRAIPAVLTDVAASWPCASKWTLAFFAREHGDLEVSVDDGSNECERR